MNVPLKPPTSSGPLHPFQRSAEIIEHTLACMTRQSAREFGSVATSGTITRVFKNAAVAHNPPSRATGTGAIARVQSRGTFGPAVGQSFCPAESINRIVVTDGEI